VVGGGGLYVYQNRHRLFSGDTWRRDSYFDNGTALLDGV
jgi:hypothetical protein